MRATGNIINEIMKHQKQGINNFIFKDSIFNLYKAQTTELCNDIIDRGIKIKWMCNSRVDTLSEDLLALMSKAGCINMSFGIESLSPTVLKKMNKKTNVDKIKNAFELCKKHNINTIAYMMIGCEGETSETNLESLDELIRLNPTLAEFSVTTAYPGTVLYSELLEKGLIREPKWYYKNVDGYLTLPYFPIEQQKEVLRTSYLKFFFRPFKIMQLGFRFFHINLLAIAIALFLSAINKKEF